MPDYIIEATIEVSPTAKLHVRHDKNKVLRKSVSVNNQLLPATPFFEDTPEGHIESLKEASGEAYDASRISAIGALKFKFVGSQPVEEKKG